MIASLGDRLRQRACHHFELCASHSPLSLVPPNLPTRIAKPLHSTSHPNLRIDTARIGSSLDETSPDLSSIMTSDSRKSSHLRGMPQHPSIAFPVTIHTNPISKMRSLVRVQTVIHEYLQMIATVETAPRHQAGHSKLCVLPHIALK